MFLSALLLALPSFSLAFEASRDPAAPVGATSFSLEPFGGKTAETFELAAPAGYQAPKAEQNVPRPNLPIPGIVNENGTGPADGGAHGKVSLPSGAGLPGK